MEGQIFDEGKVLLTKTVKKCFPSPGTAAAATDVLLRLAAGIRLMADDGWRRGKRAAMGAFRLA
jgi:hypothetical protein